MNILFICGEASANSYASLLAQSLTDHGNSVYSFGDATLAKHSNQLLHIDTTRHSVGHHPFSHKKILRLICNHLNHSHIQFDRIVIVDFPNYNFQIAAHIQSLNIPIITFITPNFWLWKDLKKAKKLVAYSQKIITIFEEEHRFYSQLSPEKTVYFGHPLSITPPQPMHQLSQPQNIGLFPGSRQSEILDHLPIFCTIIKQLDLPDFSVTIFCDQAQLHPMIQDILSTYKLSIPISSELKHPISFAITAPGTNTLKLAYHLIPMIIIGQLHPFMYWIAKYLYRIKIPFIGLPNAILNQYLCPEYIQPSNNTNPISKELRSILNDPSKIQSIQLGYKQLQASIQAPADYYSIIAKEITGR